jgi:uncharacterized membrane protein YbhN (UPF0104 family)
MADWLHQLWDAITAVSVPLLLLGLAFQAGQTLFVALAWRNILRYSYPEGGVRYRPILAYYAGGVGINAVLPASAGTVAMIGLFRARIRGATVPGILGATVVQNVFFVVVSALVYLWLFIDAAGSFDVEFGWFHDHPVATAIILIGGAILIWIVGRLLYTRFNSVWESAKTGGGILRQPRTYLTQVAGVEALSYVSRMCVNATFMHAFGVPVSVENVFLIVAASSISSTVALLPGAVGAQTALATVVLKGTAPASVISAYTVGQAIITTAFNVAFGAILLAREIGWPATKQLFHRKRKGSEGDGSDGGEPTPVAADAPS